MNALLESILPQRHVPRDTPTSSSSSSLFRKGKYWEYLLFGVCMLLCLVDLSSSVYLTGVVLKMDALSINIIIPAYSVICNLSAEFYGSYIFCMFTLGIVQYICNEYLHCMCRRFPLLGTSYTCDLFEE